MVSARVTGVAAAKGVGALSTCVHTSVDLSEKFARFEMRYLFA